LRELERLPADVAPRAELIEHGRRAVPAHADAFLAEFGGERITLAVNSRSRFRSGSSNGEKTLWRM
jgi:hypothetical protein